MVRAQECTLGGDAHALGRSNTHVDGDLDALVPSQLGCGSHAPAGGLAQILIGGGSLTGTDEDQGAGFPGQDGGASRLGGATHPDGQRRQVGAQGRLGLLDGSWSQSHDLCPSR